MEKRPQPCLGRPYLALIHAHSGPACPKIDAHPYAYRCRIGPDRRSSIPAHVPHAQRSTLIHLHTGAALDQIDAHPCALMSRMPKDRCSSICIQAPHWTRSAFHRSLTDLNPRASTLILAALRLAALYIRILLGLCAPHCHLAKERPGPSLALFLLHFDLE